METKEVTQELNEIISYMTNVLINEFPYKEITSDYLIASLFHLKNSRAYMILSQLITLDDIEKLRNIYLTSLQNKSKKLSFIHDQKIKFNNELTDIFENGENEQKKMKSPLLGSEHILLAMLNPNNHYEHIIDVFNNIGIDYNLILVKCNAKNKLIRPIQFQQKMINPFQLKSDVNNKIGFQKNAYISQFTTSVNNLVKENKIDKLIGRQEEVEKLIKVLARRKKNNAVLVGEGGCGKTHIIYGLADMIINDTVPNLLKGNEIIMLNITALVSGTHFRGMFEERINGLFNELKNSNKYILFIDDIHNVLKSSNKDKDNDLSSVLGNILSEGDVKIIGTTTFKEYRNTIETNSTISRKFQKIIIEPTSIDDTFKILESNKKYYEEHHNVKYPTNIIHKIIELSDRYITTRTLPDSAIDVMDLCGAQKCLNDRYPKEYFEKKKELSNVECEKEKHLSNGEFEIVDVLNKEINSLKQDIFNYKQKLESNKQSLDVEITIDDVNNAITDMCGVPIQRLEHDEKKQIANIGNILKNNIIGQDEAIDSVCKVIKRNKVGLGNKNKTMGNLLLVGGSGTGKTLIAKQLAKHVFGSEKELVRIDMSEYSEKNSVSKLTGAAPGYIGYDNGGQLTEAIKNKQHCVLLLDEIEKANQEVYNMFLQLFDEGRLTDSSGQIVNFKNVIVIMTSNVGAKQASEHGNGIGFITNETVSKKSIIDKNLKNTFTPEFLNRIDQIIYFNKLTDENLKQIVKLELDKFINRLREIDFNLMYDNDVLEYLFKLVTNEKEYGARPIIRIVQHNIEDAITDLMLNNDYEPNYTFKAIIENNNIVIN